MDQNERIKLQKQYEQYVDAQVIALLQDGPAAFVDGAYRLLEEEAQRRGIAPEASLPDKDEGEQPDAFVEIMVIGHDTDREAAVRAMESAGIPYHFMKMSMAGRELPLALMVDQLRIEHAVAVLQPVRFANSIVLW